MACEYCNEDLDGGCEYIGNWKTGFYIEDGKLKACLSWHEASINYCPMCGERLDDTNE